MPERDFRVGRLKSGGRIETDSGEILLTRVPPQAAQPPEFGVLEIPLEDLGRLALVRGTLSGNVLYSAVIVEIIPPVTGGLLQTLTRKELLSYEELEDQVSTSAAGRGKLCALVIGHKKNSPGSINTKSNLTEFDFNEALAVQIEKKLQTMEIQRVYRRTYQTLPGDINTLKPDFMVSLHCNAFNERASGTEVLYYYRSKKGKKMAEILLKHLVAHLGLPNRGTKPRKAEDRGGYLLRYTRAPCVIVEPFFIDNDTDLARARSPLAGLANAYIEAIEEIARTLEK